MSERIDADMVARYLEGDLTTSQAREFDDRLRSSPEARELFEREKALFAMLAEVPPSLGQIDVLEGVRARLDRPPRRNPAIFAALAAVILSSIGLGAFVAQRGDMRDVVARSGSTESSSKWMGIRTWTMTPAGPKRVENVVRSDSELLFSYANLGPSPATHLMVFAKDSTESIRWYHPAWLDAAENPEAVAIESGTSQELLPDAIRHKLSEGPLVIHALFLDRPLSVQEVERRLKLTDPNFQAVRHQVIRVEVR